MKAKLQPFVGLHFLNKEFTPSLPCRHGQFKFFSSPTLRERLTNTTRKVVRCRKFILIIAAWDKTGSQGIQKDKYPHYDHDHLLTRNHDEAEEYDDLASTGQLF